MENRCSVLGCLNTSDDGFRLHEFPFDDEKLLPIWIMATNRPNWLPIDKSRICGEHFDMGDYEAGNKGNSLRQDACPIIRPTTTIVDFSRQGGPKDITHGKILTDSEDSECSSTSDINSDDLLDTPNTSDMKSNDDDSTLSTSSCSNFSNSNEANGFDDDFLSSLSDTEFELENIDIDESMIEVDSASVSSSVTSFVNINQECAVVLCNQNARDQFDTLFFISFPKDNKSLCETWWKICGRNDIFDPSLKICSIHFDPEDFTSITIRREGQLFRQTILKNNNSIPTLYLLSHEYTKFARKRKRSVNDSYSIKNKKTDFEYCIIQGCDKKFLKDGKQTLFFKFPLENKNMLKKWVDSIGLPNWQPTDTDRICSDHFENDDILMTNDIFYGLNNDAIPSIKPQNSFVISSEDNYDRKHVSKVNSRYIDNIFNNLKSRHLENNTLIVKDITKGKMNKSLLLNLLENDVDQEPENHQSIFNTCAVQSSSAKINSNKVLTDGYNQTKLVSKPDEKTIKENSLKNIHTSNITTISRNKSISKVIKKSLEESIEKNISEEKNMIPKSRNNGNDCDYIYLDMLDGDDAKNVLSFEKKSISKNSKTNILQLLEKNHTDGIPESIIYNQDLTECYGEMLSPSCDQDCQLICYYSMPGPDRRQIYKEFQMLDVTEQNCKITQLVQLRISKKKDSTFESCPTYCFIWNKESVKVCRTFFMNTLGIPDNRLDAILKPINYSWYSDRDIALKANQPRELNIISEPVVMTDFMKESLIPLNKDYNSYEPESDPEVSLENVPFKEYQNVFLYMKGIPRVLSSYQIPGTLKKHCFETSMCLEYMYKAYSENFIRNNTPPPFTKRQFKKIYNQYMKTFLKMV